MHPLRKNRPSVGLVSFFMGGVVVGFFASVGAAEPSADAKPTADPTPVVKPQVEGDTAWYDVKDWGVEGRGWTDTQRWFDRLPAKAEKTVRKPVWQRSRYSSGMSVRFETDATTIRVRYRLLSRNLAMVHMPATGASGADLYIRHEGQWRHAGLALPNAQRVDAALCKDLDPGRREYRLYLPLYNGVEDLSIGVPRGATFVPLAPRREKPIVFYGTSINQGGCASRPGMAYTAILDRRLDRPVINLAFSGNGTMDMAVADLLCELDAAVYVIDCLPNISRGKDVTERAEPLVRRLRAAWPETPIVLVEDRTYSYAPLKKSLRARHAETRAALRSAYEKLMGEGMKNLYYVRGDSLLDPDGESTVDGSHPTDWGMVQIAARLEPILRPLLPIGEK